MNSIRRAVLRALAIAPLTTPFVASAAKPRMPVLFIGHGSPMNAVANNSFTQALSTAGQKLPRPRAILAVSAHWLTPGATAVLGVDKPQTIHDFGGFPDALYQVQYPALGHPGLAKRAAELIVPRADLRLDWGLDHGTWSVLRHLYPQADIPVFQVSIDMHKAGAYHWEVGKALAPLREEGVLIVGSGNIVHNLRRTTPGRQLELVATQPWAQHFDDATVAALGQREDLRLQQYLSLPGAQLAVPTPDHYFPLLYALGAAHDDGPPTHLFEGFQSGTISMRCLRFG